MDRFTIETSNLENGSSSMHNIASSVMSLADEVKAANTDNKYNIDFEKPKRIIWASVYNSSEKIESASKILTTTVEAHTDFQNANSFGKYVETSDISNIPTLASTAAGAASGAAGSTSSGNSSSSSYTNYSSSSYSSGSYSSGSTSTPVNADMASDTGTYVSTGSTTAFEQAAEGSLLIESVAFANLTGKSILKSHKFEEEDKTKPKAEYIYEYDKKSKEDDAINFEYDKESGLAKVDDMYAIRCEEKYGKVGDIIVIETKDGLRYECLIMENVEIPKDADSTGIEFYTNLPDKVTKITANLPNPDLNITKIDNYGEYDKFKDLKINLPSETSTSLETSNTGATQSTPDVTPSTNAEEAVESTNSVTSSSNGVLSLLTEDKETLVELRDKYLSSRNQG